MAAVCAVAVQTNSTSLQQCQKCVARKKSTVVPQSAWILCKQLIRLLCEVGYVAREGGRKPSRAEYALLQNERTGNPEMQRADAVGIVTFANRVAR